MKLVKTLLVTAVSVAALNASANKAFTGTYVGAEAGTSKATGAKTATSTTAAGVVTNVNSLGGHKKTNKYGVNGGVLVGHRMMVSQDVILGASLGLNIESTKTTASSTDVNARAPRASAKRKYIVNLLGQAGYTATKDVLLFVNAGVSYAQFKLSVGDYDGKVSKNTSKFGYALGAGAAYAINDTVSTDLNYLYTKYGKTKASGLAGNTTTTLTVNAPTAYHTVTVGVKVNI